MPQAAIEIAVELAEIERQLHRQRHALGRHVDIIRQRMADDFGLLVNFLGHVMAMVAFVDEQHRGLRFQHGALHDVAAVVVDLGAVARHDHPVAVFQVADGAGERRQRDGVGADIHRALAKTDRQWRAAPRADQKIVLAGEQEGERERAAQARQGGLHRGNRRSAAFHFLGDEMRDNLGVGLGGELGALLFQLAAQLVEILDNAVVHHRQFFGGMGMRVVLGRPAVRRPARVADADRAGKRLAQQPGFKIAEFAFGAAARQLAVFERGDAGGIIAAIFEALERIDELRRRRLLTYDSDYAAHPAGCSSPAAPGSPIDMVKAQPR